MSGPKKAFLVVAGFAAVAVAAFGACRAFRLLPIGAAYKAKILCSGVFMAHREPASVLDSDLSVDDLSLLRYIDAGVHPEAGSVTSRFFGIIGATAKCRPGLGCSLHYDGAQAHSVHFYSLIY